MWKQLCLMPRLEEAFLVGVWSSFDEWSLAFGEVVMWYGWLSRKKDLSGKGFRVSKAGFVRLCVELTEINSLSRLALILLFIALKTFYSNDAPHFMGVHSMHIESLVVTLMACEKITSKHVISVTDSILYYPIGSFLGF
ncbi:hypothetical protein BVRB_5g100230 [Beta vulgaris subsp. vulgaris]|nr:hypothetical protein BVRB_5g100230 [Beta vulgaris subsp. vulgaris]